MNFLKVFDRWNGNTPAIVDRNGGRVTTYFMLNELSGKAASKLQRLGLKKDDVAIVRMGRMTEYIAAELGCLKLGVVFAPVLPSYPDARVDYIRNDSAAKLIIEDDFFSDIDSYDVYEDEN